MKKSRNKNNRFLGIAAGITAFAVLGGAMAVRSTLRPSDPESTSAMILNSSGTSGGSGVVLESKASLSKILTNRHVCEAVQAGGIVRTRAGDFQVVTFVQSDRSDLCLVTVAADLRAEAKVASFAPKDFDTAEVVGHPTLLPTISTKGHFAGRKTIEVMTGVRPCSEQEKAGPLAFACIFMGGMPIVRKYESNIVTATIMPGSSGSPVFNSSGEVSGLVFAGMGGLSYAFVVPLEQIRNFLETEINLLEEQSPKLEFMLSEILFSNGVKKGRASCGKGEKGNKRVCQLIDRSALWSD